MTLVDVRFYRDCGLLQPPRRQRSRSDDKAFQDEHLERLRFIRRALACGFGLEDIARFVDPLGLVTCNDVKVIASRRLQDLRRAGAAESDPASCLSRLVETCAGVGPGRDCSILQGLARPGG
jgi:DNA-binding transcriptional MerR regulator